MELTVQYPQHTFGRSNVMPNTLTTALLPLNIPNFSYVTMLTVVESNPVVNVILTLQQNSANLLTFGIYGRDFDLDRQSGADKTLATTLLIAFAVILSHFY